MSNERYLCRGTQTAIQLFTQLVASKPFTTPRQGHLECLADFAL